MQQSKLIFICLTSILLAKNVHATKSGAYIGGQVGWGYVHQGTYIGNELEKRIGKAIPKAASTLDRLNILFRDTGLAERVFVGFQFNPYFAAEVGYYHFTPINVTTELDISINILKQYKINVPLNLTANAKLRTYALDFMAKGIYPVTDKFSIYGKLGLAYLNSEGELSLSVNTNIGKISLSTNSSVNIVYPEASIGLNYDLTNSLSTDFSWSHIQKINPCPYPNIDFIGVGLLYRFD